MPNFSEMKAKIENLLANAPPGVTVEYVINDGSIAWSLSEKPVGFSRAQEQQLIDRLNLATATCFEEEQQATGGQQDKHMFNKLSKKQRVFGFLALSSLWLIALFGYAIPNINKGFSGIHESDNALTGTVTCVNNKAENFIFTPQGPGMKIFASREGFMGQGEPYIKITTPLNLEKRLSYNEGWICTDSNGNTQQLFHKNESTA